jgi:translation elongation factor P/translation initiation factor 5A
MPNHTGKDGKKKVPKGMHMMPDGSLMKDSDMKKKKMGKGSQAMKDKMKRLRDMRKK